MSLYRKQYNSLYGSVYSPTLRPYKDSMAKRSSGLKRTIIDIAVGAGAYLLLRGASKYAGKTFINAVEKGALPLFQEGYTAAKKLRLLSKEGSVFDILRTVSSGWRNLERSVKDVTKPYIRAARSFDNIMKYIARPIGSERRASLLKQLFKKYPIKQVLAGKALYGLGTGVGIALTNTLVDIVARSAYPHYQEDYVPHGIKAFPVRAKQFFGNLLFTAVPSGLFNPLKTYGRYALIKYSPRIEKFVRQAHIHKFIGSAYGTTARFMNSVFRNLESSLKAQQHFLFSERGAQKLLQETFINMRRFAKHGNYFGAVKYGLRSLTHKLRVLTKETYNYYRNYRKSHHNPLGLPEDFIRRGEIDSRHIENEWLYTVARDLAVKAKVKGEVEARQFGKSLLRKALDKEYGMSWWQKFLGIERSPMGKHDTQRFLNYLRTLGVNEEDFKRFFGAADIDQILKSGVKLYYGGIYEAGGEKIGYGLVKKALRRAFVLSQGTRYRGFFRIVTHASGLMNLVHKTPKLVDLNTERWGGYIPIGRKRILLTNKDTHGLVYADHQIWTLLPKEGGEKAYELRKFAEGYQLYNEAYSSLLRREVAAAYYRENAMDVAKNRDYANPIRTLRKWIKTLRKSNKPFETLMDISSKVGAGLEDLYGRLQYYTLLFQSKVFDDHTIRRNLFKKIPELREVIGKNVFEMDDKSLVDVVKGILQSDEDLPNRIRITLKRVLSNYEGAIPEVRSSILRTQYLGSELSEVSARRFLESFLITYHLKNDTKLYSKIYEKVIDPSHVPKLYKMWSKVASNILRHKSVEALGPDAVAHIVEENLDDLYKVLKATPNVDIMKPVSAVLKVGGLGLEDLFDVYDTANFVTTNAPYAFLKTGFSLKSKEGVSAFEAWAAPGMRVVWQFLDKTIGKLGLPFLRTDASNMRFMDMVVNLWRPAAVVSAASFGYRVLDAFLDENPIPGLRDVLESTGLGEGLNPIIADTYALGRLSLAKFTDTVGITSAAQYLEGIMPGSTTFLPGAVYGAYVGSSLGLPGMLSGALVYGAVNRILSPLLPDLTKSTKDLEDIYSGRKEVPVRRNRWWLLSLTPYEGYGIEYFRPSFYHMIKQQYSNTKMSKWQSIIMGDWMFGFNPIRQVIDPYYKERMRYFSRPAPMTELPFWNVPIIGPALSMSIGQILKPQKYMHEIFLFETSPGTIGSDFIAAREKERGDQAGLSVYSPHDVLRYLDQNPAEEVLLNNRYAKLGQKVSETMAGRALSEMAYRTTEMMGLRGYFADVLMGTQTPLAADKYLEMSGENEGFMSWYWSAELNDVGGGFTEILRRFRPDKRINTVNPIPNAVYLPPPYNFDTKGDVYTKIKMGLARLPGPIYERLHRVFHTFPGSADMLGRSVEEIRDIMTGWEDIVDDKVKDLAEVGVDVQEIVKGELRAAGLLVKEDIPVYDPYNNVFGIADALIKRGNRAELLSIRTLSPEEFEKITKPLSPDISQLNFFLMNTKNKFGRILYVNRKDPTQYKEFTYTVDPNRYKIDMSLLNRAREKAEAVRESGFAYDYGRSYSWMDRLRILADVAPFSDQYKTALWVVSQQIKSGVLPPEAKDELNQILEMRQQKIQRYPIYFRRFTGYTFKDTVSKILSPKPMSKRQLNMSLNPFVKSPEEYSFPERIAGALWETFTHLNTPYQQKFFFQYDPYELYKKFNIYDKEYKDYLSPYSDWIKPYVQTTIASNTALEGTTNFTIGGLFLGGMAGAALAAPVGALYGVASSAVQKTLGAYIPKDVRNVRKLTRFYDQLKYMRNMQFYALTGNDNYLEQAHKTMYGARNISEYLKGLPTYEKPFAVAFLNTTDERTRASILDVAPDYMKPLLMNYWYDLGDKSLYDSQDAKGKLPIPDSQWAGWSMEVDLPTIETKEIKQLGLDPRDYGLGFGDQMRMANQLRDDALLYTNDVVPVSYVDVGQLVQVLRSACKRAGFDVSVSILGGDMSNVTVDVYIP